MGNLSIIFKFHGYFAPLCELRDGIVLIRANKPPVHGFLPAMWTTSKWSLFSWLRRRRRRIHKALLLRSPPPFSDYFICTEMISCCWFNEHKANGEMERNEEKNWKVVSFDESVPALIPLGCSSCMFGYPTKSERKKGKADTIKIISRPSNRVHSSLISSDCLTSTKWKN